MGLFAILNSFLDRERLWTTLVGDLIPAAGVSTVTTMIPDSVLGMQIRHFGLAGWLGISCILVSGSFYRVLTHEFVTQNKLHWSAVSKLVTPLLIAMAPFWLPTHVMENETRHLSVCMGLLMSFLTKKMICFSMAKQSYASIQMEAIPYWAVIQLIRYDDRNESIVNDRMAKYLLGGLCHWYAYRLLSWAKSAIDQICDRLDINCLTIKQKPQQQQEEETNNKKLK